MEILKGYGSPDFTTRGEKGDLYVDLLGGVTYRCLGASNPGVDLGYVNVYKDRDAQYIWEVAGSTPAAYIVNTVEDLPKDVPHNSLAVVLGVK